MPAIIMPAILRCKCDYFGYSVEFNTDPRSTVAERRAQANDIILKAFGMHPVLAYVEPGLPFPDYVPVRVWQNAYDDTPAGWY